jgi:hypothetical protein
LTRTVRVGQQIRYRTADLVAWLDDHRVAPVGSTPTTADAE